GPPSGGPAVPDRSARLLDRVSLARSRELRHYSLRQRRCFSTYRENCHSERSEEFLIIRSLPCHGNNQRCFAPLNMTTKQAAFCFWSIKCMVAKLLFAARVPVRAESVVSNKNRC